jgi:hypothetical protein
LTEAVRRKPYAVVVFDEIEKAHDETILFKPLTLEEITTIAFRARSRCRLARFARRSG